MKRIIQFFKLIFIKPQRSKNGLMLTTDEDYERWLGI